MGSRSTKVWPVGRPRLAAAARGATALNEESALELGSEKFQHAGRERSGHHGEQHDPPAKEWR
eukprot:scaffold41760_cov32-Tisochrysis_lutea.AAC.3